MVVIFFQKAEVLFDHVKHLNCFIQLGFYDVLGFDHAFRSLAFVLSELCHLEELEHELNGR